MVAVSRESNRLSSRRRVEELRHPASDAPLTMSVNISARQFQRPDELVREVARLLEETGLAPGSLVLEITESIIMEEAEHNVDVLGRLKDL